jgi:hypothetical protein
LTGSTIRARVIGHRNIAGKEDMLFVICIATKKKIIIVANYSDLTLATGTCNSSPTPLI